MNGQGELFQRAKQTFLELSEKELQSLSEPPQLRDVVPLLASQDLKQRSYAANCILKFFKQHIESESYEFVNLGGPQALFQGLQLSYAKSDLVGGRIILTSFVGPYFEAYHSIFDPIISDIVDTLLFILENSFEDSQCVVHLIYHPEYTTLMEKKIFKLVKYLSYSSAPEHQQWIIDVLRMVDNIDCREISYNDIRHIRDGISHLALRMQSSSPTTIVLQHFLDTLVFYVRSFGSAQPQLDDNVDTFIRSIFLNYKGNASVKENGVVFLVELAKRNQGLATSIFQDIPNNLVIDFSVGSAYWNLRALVTFMKVISSEHVDLLLKLCSGNDGETCLWAAYALHLAGLKPTMVEAHCNIDAIIQFLTILNPNYTRRHSGYPVVDAVFRSFAGSESVISKLKGQGTKLVENLKTMMTPLNHHCNFPFLLYLADSQLERWETLLPLTKSFIFYYGNSTPVEDKQIVTFFFECSFEHPHILAKAGAVDKIFQLWIDSEKKDNVLLYTLWNIIAVGSTHQSVSKNLPSLLPSTGNQTIMHIVAQIQWLLQNTEMVDTYKDLSTRSCGCMMPSNFCHNKSLYQSDVFEDKSASKSKKKKKKVVATIPSTHQKTWSTLARLCTQAINMLTWRNHNCDTHHSIVSNLFDNVIIALEILKFKGSDCGELPVRMARIGLAFNDAQVILKSKSILKFLGKPIAAPPPTKAEAEQRELEQEMECIFIYKILNINKVDNMVYTRQLEMLHDEMDKLRCVAKNEFDEADKTIKELTLEVDIITQQKAEIQAKYQTELKAAQPQSLNDVASHMSRLSLSPFDFIQVSSLSSLSDIDATKAQLKHKMAELKKRKAVIKEEKKKEEKEKIKEMISCPICMDRKKDTIMQPCGHSFCKFCAETITTQSGKCPICRIDVLKMVPFFI